MKVSPLLSKKGSNSSANAANSLSITPLRTGKNISGAFLFLAFIAIALYSTAPSGDSASKASNVGAPAPASAIDLQVAPATTPPESPTQSSQAPSTEPQTRPQASTGVSTNVTTTNGQTEVTVNGQPVTPDNDGSINKSVNTNDGTVQINVSQTSANQGNSSSSVRTRTSTSSSSFSNNWSNGTMITP